MVFACHMKYQQWSPRDATNPEQNLCAYNTRLWLAYANGLLVGFNSLIVSLGQELSSEYSTQLES